MGSGLLKINYLKGVDMYLQLAIDRWINEEAFDADCDLSAAHASHDSLDLLKSEAIFIKSPRTLKRYTFGFFGFIQGRKGIG